MALPVAKAGFPKGGKAKAMPPKKPMAGKPKGKPKK